MEVMTLEEVAKMLRVSEQTIYELARSGNLPGRKVGREWRFLKHSILEWFEDGENGEPRCFLFYTLRLSRARESAQLRLYRRSKPKKTADYAENIIPVIGGNGNPSPP